MNDQVELVKSKIDIVEIIGERVILKKAGRHFKGLCPFHSEKSPSFIVSAERQSFKCFGCQEGGDVLTFMQKYDGYSFLEALEVLAKRVGVTLESYRPTSQDSYKKKLLEIMSLATEYYHYLLTKHQSGEEARQYLKARGINSEAIGQFYLGYAPNQWRSVSDFLINKKKYAPEELEAVGLVIRKDSNSFYDRFRGRVMFPLKDHKGVVVGFSGRTLIKDEKEAKYINSPETMLYSKSRMLYGLWENREQIRKADSIVLVEGELDVIPSWQVGIKNYGKHGDLHLAYLGQDLVGALLILYHDSVATYWAAFASPSGYKSFAPTLLTWTAMKKAKENKSEIFDFGGIYDPRYPKMYSRWIGFTKFKSGFNPTVISYPPTALQLFW